MDFGSIFMKIYVIHTGLAANPFVLAKNNRKFCTYDQQWRFLSLGSKSIEIRCNLLAFLLSDNDEIVLFFLCILK